MPPDSNIDPGLMAFLQLMGGAGGYRGESGMGVGLPEWDAPRQSYMPMDVGNVAANTNLQQDYAQMAMDPLMQLAYGMYNPDAFVPEQKPTVTPAVTAGADMLSKILATAVEGSPEFMLAGYLLHGDGFGGPRDTPTTAVTKLQEEFGDQLDVETWTKLANDWFMTLLKDTPEQVTYEEVDTPGSKLVKDLGLPDPYAQFSPSDIDPTLLDKQQKAVEADQALQQLMTRRPGRQPSTATFDAKANPRPTPMSPTEQSNVESKIKPGDSEWEGMRREFGKAKLAQIMAQKDLAHSAGRAATFADELSARNVNPITAQVNALLKAISGGTRPTYPA